LPNLPIWTKEEADRYENLENMYGELVGQFSRYMGHVTKNVGGIYETFKSVEQSGDVYEPTPRVIQKDAVKFLNEELFITPTWLLNKEILNKFSNPAGTETVESIQTSTLNSLLSSGRLFRMSACSSRFGPANTYRVEELTEDLKNALWTELATGKPIDVFRRNLQKNYVDALVGLMNPSPSSIPQGLPRALLIFFGADIRNTDIPSIARANLESLKNQIQAAIPLTTDKLSKYHLLDVLERIKQALHPRQ
jgi:hypothetical protein